MAKNTYIIPGYWERFGTLEVAADSLEEALLEIKIKTNANCNNGLTFRPDVDRFMESLHAGSIIDDVTVIFRRHGKGKQYKNAEGCVFNAFTDEIVGFEKATEEFRNSEGYDENKGAWSVKIGGAEKEYPVELRTTENGRTLAFVLGW